VQCDIARDFEQCVADKEDAGAEPEYRRAEAELMVHAQRGEADVHAVHVIDDEQHEQQRHEAPVDAADRRCFERVVQGLSPVSTGARA